MSHASEFLMVFTMKPQKLLHVRYNGIVPSSELLIDNKH